VGELRDPVPPAEQAMLRRAVLEHVRSLRGRTVAPVVHVGVPGGPTRSWPIRRDEPVDHALRADVVSAMVGLRPPQDARVSAPWVWLTRGGELVLHDLDVQWLAAACTAYGEAGLELTMVVVNRRGWRDPRSGLSRTWVRLRP
jgi:hypothetical protein